MKFTVLSIPGQQNQQMPQQQVQNMNPSLSQQDNFRTVQQPQQMQQPEGIGQQLAGSPLANAARSGIGLLSDIGADIAGTPGNIASLGLGFGNWLSGGAIPTYQQVQEKLPISIPTGEDIKGAISKATGGYTEPRSGTESTIRDVLGTAASLALPSRLVGKAGAGLSKLLSPEKAAKVGKAAEKVFLPFSGLEVSPQRALGLATAGEVGSKGAEALGGGPVEQALTKILFMGAANTAGTRAKLSEKMTENYTAADKAINNKKWVLEGKDTNAIRVGNLKSKVNVLKDELKKSASPSNEEMSKFLNTFDNALTESSKVGFVRADDLTRLKRQLNEWIQRNEVPRFEGQPFTPKAVRNEAERLLGSVKESLSEVAQKNPEFGKSFAMAEDLAKGLLNSYNLGQFFKNNIGLEDVLESKLSKIAFGGAGLFGLHHPVIATGLGTAAWGVNEAFRLKKLLKVPAARKAYQEAITAALRNDVRDFAAKASKFDKMAQNIK